MPSIRAYCGWYSHSSTPTGDDYVSPNLHVSVKNCPPELHKAIKALLAVDYSLAAQHVEALRKAKPSAS